jgi:hypothetical protein
VRVPLQAAGGSLGGDGQVGDQRPAVRGGEVAGLGGPATAWGYHPGVTQQGGVHCLALEFAEGALAAGGEDLRHRGASQGGDLMVEVGEAHAELGGYEGADGALAGAGQAHQDKVPLHAWSGAASRSACQRDPAAAR